MQNLDITTNYAQANMLKMLQTAKDIVSSAKVENSLNKATKTIENWSRKGGSLPAQSSHVSTTETLPSPFTHIATNNFAQRSLTPSFAQHDIENPSPQHVLEHRSRPTPLNYSILSSSNSLYDGMLRLSSISSPHLAMYDQRSEKTCHMDTPSKSYIDQVPDIYAKHQKASLMFEDPRWNKEPHSCLVESVDLRGLHDQKAHTVCLTDVRANNFRQDVPSTESLKKPADTACSLCFKSHMELDGMPVIRRRKLYRRPSFLKATWGPGRVRFPNESSNSSGFSRTEMPDLFPFTEVRGHAGTSVEHIHLHPFRRHAGRSQKLRHSDTTCLPSYSEALHHNGVGVKKATGLVHRQYSYPDLPAFRSPSPYGPAALCNIFPFVGHPSDSVHRGFRAAARLQDDHLLSVPGSSRLHRVSNTGVPLTWSRISSLESEV